MKTLHATSRENLIGKRNLRFLIEFVVSLLTLTGFVIMSANDARGENNLSATGDERAAFEGNWSAELKVHKVDRDCIRGVKAQGYRNASVEELIELRDRHR